MPRCLLHPLRLALQPSPCPHTRPFQPPPACSDPAHFPAILRFMRDGATAVPEDMQLRQDLRAEAAYFGCWPLVEACDAAEERHACIEVGGRRGEGGLGCLWLPLAAGASRSPLRTQAALPSPLPTMPRPPSRPPASSACWPRPA